jgi:hypothetical protein
MIEKRAEEERRKPPKRENSIEILIPKSYPMAEPKFILPPAMDEYFSFFKLKNDGSVDFTNTSLGPWNENCTLLEAMHTICVIVEVLKQSFYSRKQI